MKNFRISGFCFFIISHVCLQQIYCSGNVWTVLGTRAHAGITTWLIFEVTVYMSMMVWARICVSDIMCIQRYTLVILDKTSQMVHASTR